MDHAPVGVVRRLLRVIGEVNGVDPATDRDVLGEEAAEPVLAPGVRSLMDRLVDDHAPVSVVDYRCDGARVRACIRDRHDRVLLLSLIVEHVPPYRVEDLSVVDLIPRDLPDRLPMDFSGYAQRMRSDGNMFVVFSGLPGTGKSTLADAVGKSLGIPVFNADWLLGSLTPFGGYHVDDRQIVGAELLTTLAFRQLSLGQSVILDFPTEHHFIRHRWRSLASLAGLELKVVVCTCPDVGLHRRRLESRRRGIPGWHDGGNWPSVESRIPLFAPWEGTALTVDTMRSHESNVAAVLEYLHSC